MDHCQVGMGEGKPGGDPVIVGELAQVVNEGGGGMARQGSQAPSRNEGKVQMFHLKQADRIDAVQRGNERGTAHPRRCATQAIQGGLPFSFGNHQQRFQQHPLWLCRKLGEEPPETHGCMFARAGDDPLQHTDPWQKHFAINEMGHDSLDTTMLYVRGTKQDLQQDVEKIAWT